MTSEPGHSASRGLPRRVCGLTMRGAKSPGGLPETSAPGMTGLCDLLESVAERPNLVGTRARLWGKRLTSRDEPQTPRDENSRSCS